MAPETLETTADALAEGSGPGLFTMVEVEINSRCNKRCVYCPVSVDPPNDQPRLMDPALYERLLDELARLEFAGRLSYHFYNEPLLHPRIVDVVRRTRERLPAVRQVLYSNGDLLTDELHGRLSDAGIARFIITSHDRKPVPVRPNQVILMPEDLTISNRGGAMESEAETLDLPCFAPSTMVIVTVTGDVLLCYEDFYRTQSFGNLRDSPLDEIWFSKRFEEVRRRLTGGDRTVTPVCRSCNNRSHQRPEPFDYVP
jgi:2-deoxy-scyllo-inosamine dehydrogenase (SAM-dependent)